MDHPLVRKSHTCPLCLGPKDTGLVACWPCFREHDMRNGSQAADDTLDAREGYLEACNEPNMGLPYPL
jgi:hypothetical protein